MSDARLFPGWDTMLWKCPPVMGDAWGSTTEGFEGGTEPLVTERGVIVRPHADPPLEDLCREYSSIACDDGPFLELRGGVIVAEWWRGGRFAPRDSYYA